MKEFWLGLTSGMSMGSKVTLIYLPGGTFVLTLLVGLMAGGGLMSFGIAFFASVLAMIVGFVCRGFWSWMNIGLPKDK